MKDPLGLPGHNQYGQEPGQPADQASVADQRTAQLSAVQDTQKSNLSVDQIFMATQDTGPLGAIRGSPPATYQNVRSSPQRAIRQLLNAGLARLQEPQPEGLFTRGLKVVKPDARLGALAVLTLTNALGLLAVSFSYYLSVSQYQYVMVEPVFLGGLLLMFVPNFVRLLSPTPSRLERLCLLCILGIFFYFVQFISFPLHFSAFDDFLHWRTAYDILRTGHLFSENSMLPASPYYPGLEIVTNAVSTLTGLSTYYAGIAVISASRLLLILSLYLLYEQITGSSRMAGIAMLIYMANPHFIFFDNIYNYETLALPLAIFMVYILARFANTDRNHRWFIATAWVVLAAVTITHHMTDYFFDGLLLLWAIVSFFQPVSGSIRIHLVTTATLGILLSLAYAFLIPGNPVWSYLFQYFGGAFNQLQQIITGTSTARPLFVSTPIWDRLFITGSVVLITFTLPFGLLCLQGQHRHNAQAVTFGIVSLAYPITQAFRFTTFGSEITDRAAAFLFLPIAYILTILIAHFWPTWRLSKQAISVISGALIVIFLGGVIVEVGPNLSDIPGPYLVSADARSVEPEGIEIAIWSLVYLGPNNRIATDRTNQMLMSTYGEQRIVTHLDDNVDVSPIFYSPLFDSADIAILQEGQIRYLAVDTRLSTALPLEGTYFENDRPTSIISRNALIKFNTVTEINRLFDSGDIVIYDVGAFVNGSGP